MPPSVSFWPEKWNVYSFLSIAHDWTGDLRSVTINISSSFFSRVMTLPNHHRCHNENTNLTRQESDAWSQYCRSSFVLLIYNVFTRVYIVQQNERETKEMQLHGGDSTNEKHRFGVLNALFRYTYMIVIKHKRRITCPTSIFQYTQEKITRSVSYFLLVYCNSL